VHYEMYWFLIRKLYGVSHSTYNFGLARSSVGCRLGPSIALCVTYPQNTIHFKLSSLVALTMVLAADKCSFL